MCTWMIKLWQILLIVSVSVHVPSSWCAPTCVHALGGSIDVGTLYRLSQASPGHSAQCSPLYGNHLNTRHKTQDIWIWVCWRMSFVCLFGCSLPYGPFWDESKELKRGFYSHMLSWRTKLAMLLCLKYFGRTSFANRPWSNTWKLVPV